MILYEINKKSLLVVMLAAMFITLTPMTASGATGSWLSPFGYDVNGRSEIGSANSMSGSYWFNFQVWDASSNLASSNIQLKANQHYQRAFNTTPLRQKQGRVMVSPQVTHAPWFRP